MENEMEAQKETVRKNVVQAPVASERTTRTTIYAIVEVDPALVPAEEPTINEARTMGIVSSNMYADLKEKLNKPWIISVVTIIRGRVIPFQESRKLSFF